MPNPILLSYGVWKEREVGTCLSLFYYLMVFGRGGGVGTCLIPFHYLVVLKRGRGYLMVFEKKFR
jgi:hypothetical protein